MKVVGPANIKCCICALILVLTSATSLFADYIKDAYIRLDVHRDATVDVSEEFVVYFATPHHGIYRNIPLRESDRYLRLTNLRTSEPVAESKMESGNRVLALGSRYLTVVGDNVYKLSYTMDLGKDTKAGADFFTYNILGPDWQYRMENVQFEVNFPDSEWTKADLWRGAGPYSSPFKDWIRSEDGKSIYGIASDVRPREPLTVDVYLPSGWYQGARNPGTAQRVAMAVCGVLAAAIVALVMLVWLRYGRDEALIEVPEFTPPDGLLPSQCECVIDQTTSTKGLGGTIVRWADKGWITAEEGKHHRVTITRIAEPSEQMPKSERRAWDFFFSDRNEYCIDGHEDRALADAYSDFKAKTKGEVEAHCPVWDEESVNKQRSAWGLTALMAVVLLVLNVSAFVGSPEWLPLLIPCIIPIVFLLAIPAVIAGAFTRRTVKKAKLVFLIVLLCVVASFAGAFEVGIVLTEGVEVPGQAAEVFILSLATALCAFISPQVKNCSKEYNRLLGRMLGFRDFIDKVEIDQLKKLIDDDPEYYFHTLAYAAAFGLEKKWTSKFTKLCTEYPALNTGIAGPVYISHYALSGLNSSITSAIASSVSKSVSSSSGGGGFGGGGHGGGGGGGW